LVEIGESEETGKKEEQLDSLNAGMRTGGGNSAGKSGINNGRKTAARFSIKRSIHQSI
jgi:hypothetical protein